MQQVHEEDLASCEGDKARRALEARVHVLEEELARLQGLEFEVATQRAQKDRLLDMLRESLRREARVHQISEEKERMTKRQVTPDTFDVDSDSGELGTPKGCRDLESTYAFSETEDASSQSSAMHESKSCKTTTEDTGIDEVECAFHIRNLENLADHILRSQEAAGIARPRQPKKKKAQRPRAEDEQKAAQRREKEQEAASLESKLQEVPASSATSSADTEAPESQASGEDEAKISSASSTPRASMGRSLTLTRPRAQDLLAPSGLGIFSAYRVVGAQAPLSAATSPTRGF